MTRSALGVRVSLSVAVLSPGAGSTKPPGCETVPVLTRLPVAAGSIVAWGWWVPVPPAARLTGSAMLPVPNAEQLEPAEAAHVQLADVRAAGRASATVAPAMSPGPAFVTTIV